jgi:hypothetical protein
MRFLGCRAEVRAREEVAGGLLGRRHENLTEIGRLEPSIQLADVSLHEPYLPHRYFQVSSLCRHGDDGRRSRRLERALAAIDGRQPWAPDCGLKTRGCDAVVESVTNIITATRLVRRCATV